ncbi:MAG: hypothetical protein ABIQ11_06515, partial [Saprospiraceae bacterium]
MKYLYLLYIGLFFFSSSVISAQPEKMSYQFVIRDAANELMKNRNVGVKISIIQGSTAGLLVYAETHATTTNANGLATLVIGTGTVVVGAFEGISWGDGPYFIKSETDPNGGSDYTIVGVNELLSVP